MTSDQSILSYATPRNSRTPRANWLAVFSFAWAFAVAPPVMLLFFVTSRTETGGLAAGFSPLAFIALVVTPAVAILSGYVATERGAPWDSPYRATGLAVCAVPTAWMLMVVGTLVCFRIV